MSVVARHELPADTEEVIVLPVEGMSCASCVGRVERALAAVPGVVGVNVNLPARAAYVTAGAEVSRAALAGAVAQAGYRVPASDDAGDAGDATQVWTDRGAAERAALKRATWIAALLTLPVVVLAMGGHLVPGLDRWIAGTLGATTSAFVQLGLTTLVLAWPGARFFRLGGAALLRGAPDMNALVALGAGAAYAYSAVATLAPGILPAGTAHVYFEAAAVIVTLILLGRFLEAQATGRASEAVRKLVALQPHAARVRRGVRVVDLPLGAVQVGDVIELRPGERVPVDGTVIEGAGHFDESAMTGESMPVRRDVGDPVVAGTLNQNGALAVRVARVGSDTALSQIVRMVAEAQGAKLPVQALVDRVTMWFVPAVIAAALLTFGVWLAFGPDPALRYALVNAVAVMIVACPCAMGLATPISIMVGIGRAAETGMLFRKGDALQRLSAVRVVAFDKTGTLTQGKPVLTDLIPAAGFARAEVLRAMATAEARSEHPIAHAIVAAAEDEGVGTGALTEFEAVAGFGVRAVVDGTEMCVGAGRLMAKVEADVSDFAETAARFADEGKTPLYVAIAGRAAALAAVADAVKPSAWAAVSRLHAAGIAVAMVTGDRQATAQVIAGQLGIRIVVAQVPPGGKVAAVEDLRQAHGGTYAAYAAKVGRFLPGVGRLAAR